MMFSAKQNVKNFMNSVNSADKVALAFLGWRPAARPLQCSPTSEFQKLHQRLVTVRAGFSGAAGGREGANRLILMEAAPGPAR